MSGNPARRRLLAALCAAAALFVGAVTYRSFENSAPVEGDPVAAGAEVEASREAPGIQLAHAEAISATAIPAATAVDNDPEASTIAQYTAEKYQILFDGLRYQDASVTAQLRRALEHRERLTGEMDSAARAESLALADEAIRGLLPPGDFATYELLSESDSELFRLNEYAGGVSNVAPLSPADRESILKTKLAYKARFRQMLRDSGLQRADASAAEREYAYSVTSRALEDFRRDYLQEVRQYLANDEQFALLSNYEATEFKAELARLTTLMDNSRGGS